MWSLEELQDMRISEHGFWAGDDEGYLTHGEYYRLLMKAKKSVIKPVEELYWITINPKPEADLEIFLKLLNNFVKRKPVCSYMYNIEQRGETEADAGKGFHSHLLIGWDKKQNKYIRQFCITTFKRVVGYPSDQIINIRRITKDIYQDKIDYLNGKKWDVEKDNKIIVDIIFRKKNNLSLIYKNDLSQENSSSEPSEEGPSEAGHDQTS